MALTSTISRTSCAKTVEWADWGPNWRRDGRRARGAGPRGGAQGPDGVGGGGVPASRVVLSPRQVPVVRGPALHATLRDQAVAVYGRALAHLDPPAERIDIPFEGSRIPGHLRRPGAVLKPPLVLIVPGLDSSKEEMFSIEDEFLRRGMATLSIDGPGQSENSVDFAIRPNWETVITPVLDHLAAIGLDSTFGLIGLMGISMGAIYGPRAAAHEPRLNAVVGLAGPTTSANAGTRSTRSRVAATSSTRSPRARRRRERRRSASTSRGRGRR